MSDYTEKDGWASVRFEWKRDKDLVTMLGDLCPACAGLVLNTLNPRTTHNV